MVSLEGSIRVGRRYLRPSTLEVRVMRFVRMTLVLASAFVMSACGGGGGGGGQSGSNVNSVPGSELKLPPGDGVFSASPIDVSVITQLEPLGWINPPGGHTLPTDHVYFYWNGPPPVVPLISPVPDYPVYAPGSGTVVWVHNFAGATDSKVMVRMSGTFSYIIGHLIPDAGIVYGKQVVAGQRIGQTNGLGGANAIDFGVVNEAITLTGFSNPNRYSWSQLHCDSPYKYFSGTLRTQLYGMVKRSGSEKDGRIDHDITGRLIGNWFHESVGSTSSDGPGVWPYQLAFVPDPNEPTEQRISISSHLPLPGKWKPQDGAPDFALIDVASGKVAYQLRYTEGGTVAGLMIVQLTDATHLKVEVFPGSTATDGVFTTAAKTYVR
jgi:hypothetical protein